MLASIDAMKSHPFTRREFLRSAALVSGAALALPTLVPSTVFGQNAPGNRITMGLIGMGLMMGSHHHIMLGREEVQVLAVCDVDRAKREHAKAQTEKAYGAKTGQRRLQRLRRLQRIRAHHRAQGH